MPAEENIFQETAVVEEPREATGIAALGINGTWFVAQLLHFIIVLLIFWKWVYKPVVKMLDRRAETIEKSLRDAKTLETRVAKLEEERTKVIADAKAEAMGILDAARKDAGDRKQEMVAKTKAEVERVVKDGKAQLLKEKEAMIQDAKKDMAALVVEAARKVLSDSVDVKKSQAMAEEAVELLTKV
jgi:F-type H+-transporting ATPase subunit b